tara:strand:- start:25151 stop:26560 length:1410 start_codon:yes stop_codon:yes gene_type:complete
MQLSVFDMFKIGVGPSSSHTMGPWVAARRFVCERSPQELSAITRIKVDLFGSLAKTGKGHGTDIAVQLGLGDEDPRTFDVDQLQLRIRTIRSRHRIQTRGGVDLPFDPDRDIQFHGLVQLPAHPNGMRLTAWSSDAIVAEETFYSVGGGFVVKEGETEAASTASFPRPVENADELLAYCQGESLSISDVVMQNEIVLRSSDELIAGLDEIKTAMVRCAHRGCRSEGVLPGGLNVKRRAASMAKRLLGGPPPDDCKQWIAAIKQCPSGFQDVLDWVSCFALAVNEENAAFGRVVTAPTNGAAGVIPAVLLYAECFTNPPEDFHVRFLLTASEIGCLFKKGATISAAMGGCQAEIGVSSAMAAAALTELIGGTPMQATEAAEIAMEHHLGMTCDPVGGLVQVPCIERNAMGAIKAITAAQLATQRSAADACVSLDAVIRTMWQTAQDMNSKYKETSEGGLAVQIPVNVSEC